ncbi:MAG: hypothetical protein SFW09_14150 [Hyphomicrobiaceae bacterium]|nr:hypothetical protein [Hyphomicrobiaceae bacterium]
MQPLQTRGPSLITALGLAFALTAGGGGLARAQATKPADAAVAPIKKIELTPEEIAEREQRKA